MVKSLVIYWVLAQRGGMYLCGKDQEVTILTNLLVREGWMLRIFSMVRKRKYLSSACSLFKIVIWEVGRKHVLCLFPETGSLLQQAGPPSTACRAAHIFFLRPRHIFS